MKCGKKIFGSECCFAEIIFLDKDTEDTDG
jgi:hypothetical protein